jgi:two-component system KDP operon response regulator KdpE
MQVHLSLLAPRSVGMSKPKILIIEDNPDLQTLLRLLLTHHDFVVYTASNGEEGLRLFYQQQPDLVLLDLGLPTVDGWEVLRLLDMLSDVPIVVISSRTGKREMARALQIADDYIVRPFSIHELLPRLRVVLNHHSVASSSSSKKLHPSALQSISEPPNLPTKQEREAHLTIDLERRRVYVNGQTVRLTDMEFRLLECLAKQPGHILTYRQILAYVWGWEEGRNHHYVHVHISRLRQKLEKNPKDPQYLLTEHGIGYWWCNLCTAPFFLEAIAFFSAHSTL